MMNKLFIKFKGVFVIVLMTLHSVFWCSLLFLAFLPKIFVHPFPKLLHIVNVTTEWLGHRWVGTNNLILKYISGIEFELHHEGELDKTKQYFIACNHQSWSDILILQKLFTDKISFIRFFIKKQLMWLPFLNVAWWAYDFPIMHRATKQQLKKNPSLRTKDMMATQKACAKFKGRPLTLLNFLEGTRFTKSKHKNQQSPYQNLLKPKAGGLAYALAALDHKVVNLVDVTIIYPNGTPSFLEFLGGAQKKVVTHWKLRELPTELLTGNYSDDPDYRKQFQDWVGLIWDHKDKLIEKYK